MILLTGFYIDPSAVRTAEFVECVRRNCANAYIDQIALFLEDQISESEAQARFEPLAHPKVKLIRHGRRLTYADLFEYANHHLVDTTVIVANADIFFDETLEQLDFEPIIGRMLCLSRWDEGEGGTSILYDCPFSQDAWIFEAPLRRLCCDFQLGKPGSDNRMAYEAERAGLTVSNPSRSVRARHLHQSAVRRYTLDQRIVGPGRFVPASFLKANGADDQEWSTHFPSHRARRFRHAVETRARQIETKLVPLLGGGITQRLRRELRREVTLRTERMARPDGVPLAKIAFRESMGYTIARLSLGISTHNNDDRPLVFVPDELINGWFTQVVANFSRPVEIEFKTAGRVLVFASPGWEGYAPAASYLDDAGWREPIDPLRTRDGTIFQPWCLVADDGERLMLPTQVMLAAAELVRFESRNNEAVYSTSLEA
jgi:hypothetical protein